MKLGRWILLIGVIALLALAVTVAQAAFRFERTVMSYNFTYRAMQQILEPLDDPATHAGTIREVVRSLQVPRDLEPFVIDAALVSFSASRVRHTANRWLIAVQQVLHGRAETLVLPVSLVPFRDTFLSSISGRFPPAETVQIRAAVEQIPPNFDFATEIPQEVRDGLLTAGRLMGLVQVLLQYIVPGLLIIACFFHGRIGTGIAATGIGFLAAGVPSLIVVYARAEALAAGVRFSVARALPRYLDWMLPGLQDAVAALIATGRTTAVLVTLYGLLATGVGAYLIFAKGDPGLDLRSH